ncbi:unnamed protein product, partial [Laminaria digitata]
GNSSSVPPFARLRERTFDMTKRGELTSANVWYALRRDREAAASAASLSSEVSQVTAGSAVGASSATNVAHAASTAMLETAMLESGISETRVVNDVSLVNAALGIAAGIGFGGARREGWVEGEREGE